MTMHTEADAEIVGVSDGRTSLRNVSNLRRTPAGWVEVGPTRCANGHPLTPGHVLIGWTGSRRYYQCDCGAYLYGPERTAGVR